MDRVTRYPLFSNPHSARATSLVLDENTSYTVELVGVGPEASWSQDDLQAWSDEYQARPDVKRTSVSSTTRVFRSQLPPRSLYLEDEDEEMKAYYLDETSAALCSQPRDLKAERSVIHSQAIRKGSTEPRPAGQPRPTSTEEILVDTEQIDFLAARQQFLSLEKANTNPVTWSPTGRETFAGAPPGVSQVPKASTRPRLANGYTIPVTTSPVKEVTLEKTVRVSPAGSIRAANDPGRWTRAESPETPRETPIEREIRLAQEREAELREQRGLGRAAGHQDLVQIPSRPLLSKVSLTEPPARRDRGRPSLYVQRDMVQETQREEDHRREGLQVGRASTPDWLSQDPQPGLQRSLSSDCILSPDARATDPPPEARKVNRIPLDAYQPYLGPGTPKLEFSAFGVYSKPNGVSTENTKAVAFQKATESPKHVSECSKRSPSSKQERSKPPEKPLRANVGTVRLENFRLRPLRFGVPDVPQKAETSHSWGWEVAGGPALRLQKSQSSDLLEREVESVLRREREVAEERRNAFFPEVFSPVQDQDEQDSRSSSRASGITGSYSVSESPLFTPIQLHSGLVWKVQAPEDGAPGQKTKREAWYAGINPSDSVNSEVLGATRVTRHKNVLAERWEARIYASEDED
ncbi:mitotic interactor and substrate of PLK1 [Peromyscus maniculatus bairdii]|uniref:mitotic interactor and substrate of PLK1 n=1 Tax=Peromyscus maniculatus bairdii TaxID=230844 RepID=UPI00042AABF4|nr:mitotic interactor and substrate of PLK1 [Peromyscus maniculatus bairdii]XP_042123470.1 mitotic interactor and substrate of PLK1 [Peromyscus maniculatus bairdii]